MRSTCQLDRCGEANRLHAQNIIRVLHLCIVQSEIWALRCSYEMVDGYDIMNKRLDVACNDKHERDNADNSDNVEYDEQVYAMDCS